MPDCDYLGTLHAKVVNDKRIRVTGDIDLTDLPEIHRSAKSLVGASAAHAVVRSELSP